MIKVKKIMILALVLSCAILTACSGSKKRNNIFKESATEKSETKASSEDSNSAASSGQIPDSEHELLLIEEDYYENGNFIYKMTYNRNEQGKLIDGYLAYSSDTFAEFEYNENGDPIRERYTENGKIYRTIEYEYYPSGQLKNECWYEENASNYKNLTDYDIHGNITRTRSYNKDGQLIGESESSCTYNEHGDLISDGSYTYEYVYDDNGNMLKKITTYNRDNSSRVETWEYDNNSRVVKYSEDGYIVTTYEYDKNGKMLTEAIFFGEKLWKKTEYSPLYEDKILKEIVYSTYSDGEIESTQEYFYTEGGLLDKTVFKGKAFQSLLTATGSTATEEKTTEVDYIYKEFKK